MIDPQDKADLDNDAAWIEEHRPRLMYAEDIGWPEPCEHESWTHYANEPDVGFIGYSQCDYCGICETLHEPPDEYEGEWL